MNFSTFTFKTDEDISKYTYVFHLDRRIALGDENPIAIKTTKIYPLDGQVSYINIYRVDSFYSSKENYIIPECLTIRPYYFNGKLCVDEDNKKIHIFVTINS